MMSVARTQARKGDKRSHEIEIQFAALEGQQKELAAALEDPATYTPASLPPRLYLPARFRELLRAQLPERLRCGTHAARWRAFG
jgi:hypothetical protein